VLELDIKLIGPGPPWSESERFQREITPFSRVIMVEVKSFLDISSGSAVGKVPDEAANLVGGFSPEKKSDFLQHPAMPGE
jgi:hypothetical protein